LCALSFSNISCKCHVCSFELNETCYNVINVQQIFAKFKLVEPCSIILLKYYKYFFQIKSKNHSWSRKSFPFASIYSNPTIWSWRISTKCFPYNQILTSCLLMDNRVDLNTLFFGWSHAMDLESLSKHVEKKKLASKKKVSLKFHLDNIPWCVIACTPCTNTQTFFKWC
jgi:hypothetical protein